MVDDQGGGHGALLGLVMQGSALVHPHHPTQPPTHPLVRALIVMCVCQKDRQLMFEEMQGSESVALHRVLLFCARHTVCCRNIPTIKPAAPSHAGDCCPAVTAGTYICWWCRPTGATGITMQG